MNQSELNNNFVERHLGPREGEIEEMLDGIGVQSLEELTDKVLPPKIKLDESLQLESAFTEDEFIEELKSIAEKNKVYKSYIGMGYYNTFTPTVIRRDILENPGWYTQYTPYQAEISQGRLEALINFQTMVIDLTGMPIANASLLDEATAAAEAMAMFYSSRRGKKKNAEVFLVSDKVLPQTIEVLKTRAQPVGIEIKVGNHENFDLTDNVFGMLLQYPAEDGEIYAYSNLIEQAKEQGILVAVAADIMSLTLLTPPGELGADAVVGSTQRFGVPMGYGGPHAAYFATLEKFKRSVPGRIIGVSKDTYGRTGYRMALQTREQHIKRERATSNICTAQVLLAIMAGMYAVYHGPERLRNIAMTIHKNTVKLELKLKALGFTQENNYYFDTLKIKIDNDELLNNIREIALANGVNFRYFEDDHIGISLDETTKERDIDRIVNIFAESIGKDDSKIDTSKEADTSHLPENLIRKSEFLTHPVFNSYHSETEMMRYLKRLENKDYSLTNTMIPLGSCTMKLNAASELVGLTWREFAEIHPFVPEDQALGYKELITKLEEQMNIITGFAATSVQPNSGAQGEFTGLMVIRRYHIDRAEGYRNVVLIPSSAHGTNPASSVMAGGKVVVVDCDENGNIDLDDLRKKAEEHKEKLSALMVTYPSTHGVFEEEIQEICRIIHHNGGLVYMDGANLNPQMGLTNPAIVGADVCHINLHKTFAIPHGGGGPGVGPIAVAEHLKEYLPGHKVTKMGGEKSISAVSAAPYGSASILPISYGFIRMMGSEGLTKAAQVSILNANYLKEKLNKYYKVLYTGKSGFAAHEFIFDTREFKNATNITVEDIAKRLMDYGFHAPTVSFPVPGTLMVEPTESESKAELDRFIEAMISIRQEIREIENGVYGKESNVLKNAPHTIEEMVSDNWDRAYDREKAAYPNERTRQYKIWASVSRIDNAYGDRHLMCSCLPIEEYQTEINE